jgi:hypothetical protein
VKLTHLELANLGRSSDPADREKFMDALPYMKHYEGIDFRAHPELYHIGKGEQGVLMAEPYKSEIGMHWRFRTPEIAQVSSRKINDMFHQYLEEGDFVGADMARKFLMMGWTRARRYANHSSGRKYVPGTRDMLPVDENNQDCAKAESARIFKIVYDAARTNKRYLELKAEHKKNIK